MRPVPIAPTPVPWVKLRLRLRVVGALVLVAGLVVSWCIWHGQERDRSPALDPSTNPSAPLAISDSRKQSRDVEMYYGKTGLLFERWSERLEPWTHGKRLAEVIAGISLVTATGCFFLAARLPQKAHRPGVDKPA